jgi:hypothetical protein
MKLRNVPKVKMWKSPRFKEFKAEGGFLGAEVTGKAQAQSWGQHAQVTGQVWSKASPAKSWWVVDSHRYAWLMHESKMSVLAQAGEQAAFSFEEAA